MDALTVDRIPPFGWHAWFSVDHSSKVRVRVECSGVVLPGELDLYVGVGPLGAEHEAIHFTAPGTREIPGTVNAGEWVSIRHTSLPLGSTVTLRRTIDAPTLGSPWRRRGFGPGPGSCWSA